MHDIIGLSVLFNAIIVITSKNPVLSVIFLILVFINVTIYLVLLKIIYLGLVYLIVYVGAIAILFLFVVMMLNLRLVELIETDSKYTQNIPIAIFLIILFIYELNLTLPLTFSSDYLSNNIISVNYSFNSHINELNLVYLDQIQSIGLSLYTFGSIWLIIASIILLLGMIGPIILSANS